MTKIYWNINLEEMMEAGVHFGHGTRKWNPKMAPYISAKRKGIHITNLTGTARFLSEACDLVFDAANIIFELLTFKSLGHISSHVVSKGIFNVDARKNSGFPPNYAFFKTSLESQIFTIIVGVISKLISIELDQLWAIFSPYSAHSRMSRFSAVLRFRLSIRTSLEFQQLSMSLIQDSNLQTERNQLGIIDHVLGLGLLFVRRSKLAVVIDFQG
ncbi:PREDICTED: uncharacterized protein LOC109170968 [Ipomoea nil]|uniref:uncharacterized protein LOC109170968 n=1 Tax=Ipomoea nil TaxID=35883 RepID=UPI0009009C86|nr:PREDICTED: uncharacterized protein LOC109170968 [Ipomoea nil]